MSLKMIIRQIIHVILFFLSFLLITQVLSRIEKRYIRSTTNPIKFAVRWSLYLFKKMRLLLFLVASIELVFFPNFNDFFFYIGILLVGTGIYLRISAIKELGSFWSYHACLFENHYLVESGIYSWLKHPAYIGNIHIPGLILSFGAPISSIMALFFILSFFFIRVKAENQLLPKRT